MSTLVSAGELRAELLELLEREDTVEILCAPPGHLGAAFSGRAELLRASGGRVATSVVGAYARAMLGEFAASLDRLPQTPEWERRLQLWAQRLTSGTAQVRLSNRQTAFTRMVSRPDRTLLRAGPLGSELDEPRFELTGQAHADARSWCRQRLNRSLDLTGDVLQTLQESWAGDFVSPEELYLKVLYEYFSATLGGLDREIDENPMLEWLTDFQVEAYHYAKGILRRYGGVFLADVVGLGKTFIAMALLRHLVDHYGQHAVVVAPPAILPAWEELAQEHRVEVALVSIGKLSDLSLHEDRAVLVIDESHNFRNVRTGRYDAIQEWLRPNGAPSAKQVLLLSATPQNNHPRDVLHQLYFFPDNYRRLPYRGETLDGWFRSAQRRPGELTKLLQHVVVRRTRTFIKAAYPDATIRRRGRDGAVVEQSLSFPQRICGPEQCLRYQLDGRPEGTQIYDRTYERLELMRYPLHGLGLYIDGEAEDDPRVQKLKRAGRGLRGLYKVLLLKRIESSLYAFALSTQRLLSRLAAAIEALRQGVVLVRAHELNEDAEDDSVGDDGYARLPATLFQQRKLLRDLRMDCSAVRRLLDDVELLSGAPDPKVERLRTFLAGRDPRQHRTIVFTQFSDTATSLREALGQDFGRTTMVTGSTAGRSTIVRRFSPRSNRAGVRADQEIDLLISTDALSEGVNLQDADTLINYDLHWNPVRLIQRAGRIDRIGSENDVIVVASFLPERGLEQNLGLEAVLRRRIDEFLQVFGEDSRVLPAEDKPELDEMMAAYTGSALERADASDDLDALSQHIGRILALRRDDPARFARIAEIRMGRRSVSRSLLPAIAACRVGWYWRFFVNTQGDQLEGTGDLAGLETLYQHAQQGPARQPSRLPGELVELARAAFAEEASAFIEQRSHPRLSAAEDWALDRLGDYRRVCVATQRDLVDELRRWIETGRGKTVLQREARRWKRQKLSAASVFQEVRSLAGRFPGDEEDLGSPQVVGVVVSSRGE